MDGDDTPPVTSSDPSQSQSQGTRKRAFVRWASGAMSALGPRNTNEDRYVALADVSEAQTTGTENVSPTETSPADSASLGYFAVYDGHCGAQAALHLQSDLHARIQRYSIPN